MELKIINRHEDKTKAIYSSPECQQLLAIYEEFYPKHGYNLPWVGYFVVRQNQVVGSCGFVEQPQNGKIEIAYWTFKEFEGQGIASFACQKLVDVAYNTNPGLTITAKTAPQHNASTKILETNRFIFSGIVQDHEIGDAWLWTHKGF